ncbi:MAG: PHP domain-containing protein, partial [Promethearchaeota archaeon]
MMKDYHIHPSYSIDAKGSIDEYCSIALQRELDEICFTTHLDADPKRDDCFAVLGGRRVSVQSSGWLEDYENTIRQAGDAYQQSGLEVKLGVEVDLYRGVVEDLPESFHNTDFDMIVGSVHLVDHLAVSLPEEADRIFQKYDSQQLGTVYYGLLFDMIETGFFDVLGHLDIYRRFGESHYGQEIHH